MSPTPYGPTEVPRARRLFSVSYDSVRQRELGLAAAASPAAGTVANAILVSRLRLDLVLSGQVVITDAQLLDGQLFAQITPQELEQVLAFQPWARECLVIRCRGETLEESLLGLVADADGVLKDFEFSVLSEDSRVRLSQYLRRSAAAKRPAPQSLQALTKLLQDAGVPASELAHATGHWKRWIAFLDGPAARSSGLVGTERFAVGQLAMPTAVELHDRDLPYWEDELGATSPAAEGVVTKLRDGLLAAASRTDLYAIAATEIADSYGRLIAKEYIDRVYGFALMDQHACEDYAASWQLPLRPVHTAGVGKSTSAATNEKMVSIGLCEIEMPSDFMARLGVVDATALEMWARHHVTSLRIWRDEDDKGASLKRAMDDLEHVLAAGVSPESLEFQLLDKGPTALAWGRRARLTEIIKRYVGAPVGVEMANAIAQSAGAGVLTQVVSLASRPVREGARQLMGNPAILTTDIALPRRKDSHAGTR